MNPIAQRVLDLQAWYAECERVAKAAWKSLPKESQKEWRKRLPKSARPPLGISCTEMEAIMAEAGMSMPPQPGLAIEAREALVSRGWVGPTAPPTK